MAHISQAALGLESIKASKWDDALTQLSAGLKVSPNPAWLVARSKAFIGLKRYAEALDDANQAWHTAYERNKRELLVEAQYRRAVAYFRLGQYANADACCVYCMRLVKGFPAVEKQDPVKESVDAEGFYKVTAEEAREEARTDAVNKSNDVLPMGGAGKAIPQAGDWRRASTMRVQALTAMERLPQDDAARKVTVGLKPEFKDVSKKAVEETKPAQPVQAVSTVPKDAPLRLQDFQSNTAMTVSIFSKGNNKETIQVDFLPSSVRINSIKYPSGEEKPYNLALWGEIDPSASKYTVTPSKVELTLQKKTPGKWAKLESDVKIEADPNAEKEQAELEFLKEARKKAMQASDDLPASDKGKTPIYTAKPESKEPEKAKPEEAKPAPEKPKGPTYPTSSKSGPKNWDNVGDDSDEEKDVNTFFKKLYKNATPEQQRAMMKSFTESNGTSLSTDWNDVKARTVKTVPPEGVEAKKWD